MHRAEQSAKLMQKCTGIDLLLGGHDHFFMVTAA